MLQMYTRICCGLFGLSAVWLVRSTSLRLLQEKYRIYLLSSLNQHSAPSSGIAVLTVKFFSTSTGCKQLSDHV